MHIFLLENLKVRYQMRNLGIDGGIMIMRLDRYTLWSTLQFHRCSSHRIKGGDIIRVLC
jgi:hypothetical protein